MRRLYYCDQHAFPLPSGHKFPVAKYGLLRAALAELGSYELTPAPFADASIIELAHDAEYVRAFLSGSIDPRIMRRIGFPWSEALVRRTLASVGGTLCAVSDALATGFGGNLAGGTHHAFRAEGSGFCVFNDLAIAVFNLRRDARVQRAAILDLDVHQGDGTASIFENNPAVLTISLHGENNFPFRKQQSGVDIALPDGAGDELYLSNLEPVLDQVRQFSPEIMLYQSGVDALACDRLGRLRLSPDGLVKRDRIVFEFARANGVPIAVTLGGGYADPIETTVKAHFNTFRTAARIFT